METLDALEWIEKNSLSEQDIITIINQVRAMSFVHSKTKKNVISFVHKNLWRPSHMLPYYANFAAKLVSHYHIH